MAIKLFTSTIRFDLDFGLGQHNVIILIVVLPNFNLFFVIITYNCIIIPETVFLYWKLKFYNEIL